MASKRAKNLTEETLENFFEMVKKVYEENGFFESDTAKGCISNCDESGFSTNPNQKKMFFKKSARDAYLITPTAGKAMYTILVTGNPEGEFIPPLIVYKAQNLNENWVQNGPPDACYAVSDSDWMSDIIFEKWLQNTFVPHTQHLQKPLILFFEGHGSHLTFSTVKSAMDNKIIFICLPPHTSPIGERSCYASIGRAECQLLTRGHSLLF